MIIKSLRITKQVKSSMLQSRRRITRSTSLHIFILAMMTVTPHAPAIAQWQDITSEAERIVGGKPQNAPIYINVGSIKNIKSVNYKNTIYRRADFSYSIGGLTTRERFVFECTDGSYRHEDTSAIRNWITPATGRDSVDWIAYKYLCPSSKDPWVKIAESTSEENHYLNKETVYHYQHPFYGRIFTGVLSTVKGDSKYTSVLSGELGYFYASCPRRMMAVYRFEFDPGDSSVQLQEVNPGSVGENMLTVVCQ